MEASTTDLPRLTLIACAILALGLFYARPVSKPTHDSTPSRLVGVETITSTKTTDTGSTFTAAGGSVCYVTVDGQFDCRVRLSDSAHSTTSNEHVTSSATLAAD